MKGPPSDLGPGSGHAPNRPTGFRPRRLDRGRHPRRARRSDHPARRRAPCAYPSGQRSDELRGRRRRRLRVPGAKGIERADGLRPGQPERDPQRRAAQRLDDEQGERGGHDHDREGGGRDRQVPLAFHCCYGRRQRVIDGLLALPLICAGFRVKRDGVVRRRVRGSGGAWACWAGAPPARPRTAPSATPAAPGARGAPRRGADRIDGR
jgi:hypothetical protein